MVLFLHFILFNKVCCAVLIVFCVYVNNIDNSINLTNKLLLKQLQKLV